MFKFLANIAGDSAQLRDHVLGSGVIPALENLMTRFEKLPSKTIETLAWTYSNLCRYAYTPDFQSYWFSHKNPAPHLEALRLLAPGLKKLITFKVRSFVFDHLLSFKSAIVVIDSCWALSYMTDGPDENLMVALNSGIIPDVVNIVATSDNDQM